LAPAAGPGWEEPTSQSYRTSLFGSDYVFTPAHFARGRRMIARRFPSFCCDTSDVPRVSPSHRATVLLRAQSLRGHTDCRPSTCWTKIRNRRSPACSIAGRLIFGRARLHPPSFTDSEMLPEDVIHFRTICLCPISKKKCPLERTSGCFAHSCLLKAAARSTVDFPRRCPFSVILSVPFRD
jgi:hypothetical protein